MPSTTNTQSKPTHKTLLITGASSGIGKATALAAVDQGWSVILAARNADKLNKIAAEIDSKHVLCVPTDVTDYSQLESMIKKGVETFGDIDAVFVNAGTGGEPGGFSSAPIDSWKKMLDINVLGAAQTVRAALDALKQSRGHVLLTGSVAGRKTLAGSMYSATKWAVTAIGYGLREELRGTGVRVTLIEPGMVNTPFFDEPKEDALQPEDIANSVIYALSQPKSVEVHELMVLPTPKEDKK